MSSNPCDSDGIAARELFGDGATARELEEMFWYLGDVAVGDGYPLEALYVASSDALDPFSDRSYTKVQQKGVQQPHNFEMLPFEREAVAAETDCKYVAADKTLRQHLTAPSDVQTGPCDLAVVEEVWY